MKDVLETLLDGDEITESIETNRGTFIVRFLTTEDEMEVERQKSYFQTGLPENSFSSTILQNFRVVATLNQAVKTGPDWWEKLNGAQECPDLELLQELYRGYLQFRKKMEQKIKESKFGRPDSRCKSESTPKAMDNGTFSGIAVGSKTEKSD